VDLLGLNKGAVWVNSNNLGRYWASYAADTGDGEPNNVLVLFEEVGGDRGAPRSALWPWATSASPAPRWKTT
jgi:hypothetical protein